MAAAPTHSPSRPIGNSRFSSVRIIGGQWKRSLLPVANVTGLRPTPDRVRETVFNWLSHQFGGSLDGLRVLDLFAGTGAMGFEAASRGAAHVVLTEQDAHLVDGLRAAQKKLGADMIEIQHGSATTMLQSYRQNQQRAMQQGADQHSNTFDVIFLDPPYRLGWLEKLLPDVASLLTGNGLIYAEAEMALENSALAALGLEILRADKAGQVFYHLLHKIHE